MQNNLIVNPNNQRSAGTVRRSCLGRALLGTAIVLALALDANAQFVVQPMQIVAQGRRGTILRKAFKLENRDRFESQFVTMEVVDLIQGRDGSWVVLDPNMLTQTNSGIDLSRHASCKDWITIGRTEVEVPAYENTQESMQIRIPSKARGFYCAGLKVSLKPRPGLGGVVIRYDFVVPICLSIEGPAFRADVTIESVDLKYLPAKDNQRESTGLVMTIKNNGGTYSKLAPMISVWQLLPEGRTRLMKRDLPMPDGHIIPGAELEIMVNLDSSFPSGTYRISGRLNVDGRRVKGKLQEIDFVNPSYTGVAHMDAAMRILPDNVELTMEPGSVTSQIIAIHNYSDEDIVVKAIPVVPDALARRVTTVRGEDLSCGDWIEIRPNELPVRAGGERKVSLVVRMPKADQLPSLAENITNYYATIKLYGFYRDRSSAGMTSALVDVMKKGADPTPVVKDIELKMQALKEPSRYQLVGVFANIGTIHVTPMCLGRIEGEGPKGSRTLYGTFKMTNEDADRTLMPMETREFSAEIDFSKIPKGRYIVSARLDYGATGMYVNIEKPYEVFDQNGEKLIFAMAETLGP